MISSISKALIKKEVVSSQVQIALIGAVSFILFTALGAYVYIPLGFTPVPLTLQTFFVLLSGAILGRRLGTLSQTTYVILGAAGIPFFVSGGGGLTHLAGPTGGYLLGFVLAAYVIGKLLSERDSMFSIVIALTSGELIILLSGAAWLWVGLHFGLKQAFYLGVLPFIPGDAIKLTAAVVVCKKYLPRARTLFY